MVRVSIQVDQSIAIGQSLTVTPTDIDRNGVRVIARGQIVGGPTDGERISSVHELSTGQSLHLGPHVVVTLIESDGVDALFGVLAPKHIGVRSLGTTEPE